MPPNHNAVLLFRVVFMGHGSLFGGIDSFFYSNFFASLYNDPMIFIRQLFKRQLSVFLSLRLAIIIVIANAAVVGLLGTFMYYVLAVFGWPIPTSNQLSQNEFMLGQYATFLFLFCLSIDIIAINQMHLLLTA